MRARLLAILAAGVLLTPAAGAVESAPAPAPRVDAKACAARGGEVRRICMAQTPACIVRFDDAGKPCTDKSQCQGECVYQGEDVAAGARVTGVCDLNNDPCGCRNLVRDGRAKGWLCTD